MRDIRRLLMYLGPYRKDMVTGAFLVLAETCLELFMWAWLAMIFLTFCLRDCKWEYARSWH